MLKKYIFIILLCGNGIVYCMEQTPAEASIKPYTLEEVKLYAPYYALYAAEGNNRPLFIEKVRDHANSLSAVIADQEAYKRLAASSQEVKDSFLGLLQNRFMRVNEAYFHDADNVSLLLLRTWIAICAMIDAKDNPKDLHTVFGDNGFAERFARKQNDQQLVELLTAYKQRNKSKEEGV